MNPSTYNYLKICNLIQYYINNMIEIHINGKKRGINLRKKLILFTLSILMVTSYILPNFVVNARRRKY